ncbi:MAG TPA: hypothetical protein VEY88_11840 [Archangium sp.]|nr:hypothetical protein [Archangium sp.]
MSADRYRGLFWSPEGDPVPGALEITDSGALHVEIQGQLLEKRSRWGEPDEAARIHGEIADSPFPGPVVTLFRCLLTNRKFGTGGSLERWLAHRALIGNEAVEPDAVFERVTLGIHGLAAFLGEGPPLGDFRSNLIQVPDFRTEVEQLTLGDWTAVFGWRTSRHGSATSFRLEQSPFIEIELERPRSVDEVLSAVVPVFEALLTIALQAHARVEQIIVSSSHGRNAYRVLGPRVEVPVASDRKPHESELLFRLTDMPGGPALIERVRRLFAQHPEFTALFLGHERAPPRFVEDRLRASVLTLAHVTPVFPGVSERSREWLTMLENAPAQVRAFLPSAALVAVPELARELLTPSFCDALGVTSKESFVEGIGPTFRWAALREGTHASGRELLRFNHQLRALLHLALLRFLGFEPEDAERRMVESIKQRGGIPS